MTWFEGCSATKQEKYIPLPAPRCWPGQCPAPRRAPGTARWRGGSGNRAAAAGPRCRASSYPRAATASVAGAAEPPPCPPLAARIHPKPQAKNHCLELSWRASGTRTADLPCQPPAHKRQSPGRPSPGTRASPEPSAPVASQTGLSQKQKGKKIALDPAVAGMLAGLRLLPAKPNKDCCTPEFGKPRSKKTKDYQCQKQ